LLGGAGVEMRVAATFDDAAFSTWDSHLWVRVQNVWFRIQDV